MDELERHVEHVQGEVLGRITIGIRQDYQGAWRVYPEGPHRQHALTEHGRLLGGKYEEAIRDAERIAQDKQFFFRRPSGLLLP